MKLCIFFQIDIAERPVCSRLYSSKIRTHALLLLAGWIVGLLGLTPFKYYKQQ
jgi:hypothetical protein